MATKIDTVTARDRLKARREPYWHRVSKGSYIGFRKMTAASGGTWIARSHDAGAGKQIYQSLGDFSELPDHQRFDAASKAAAAWFEHLGKGGSTGATTVTDAGRLYVNHLRETKGAAAAADAAARIRRHVASDPKFASIDLAKLTPAHIGAWRKTLKDKPNLIGADKTRSASALNRDMTTMRAMLNHAFREGMVTSDFAWRNKLVPVPGADGRRELYLDRGQRQKLIEAAQPDLALFLRALCAVPLRPGAMAALTVKDFDRRHKVLTVRSDKAGAGRKVPLPDSVADLFTGAVKGKLPTAYLFTRADGMEWNKEKWRRPVREAVTAAGLPAGTTIYTLRHSVITDMAGAGVNLMTIAQIAGTSILMIQKHYGHLTADAARDALAGLLVHK